MVKRPTERIQFAIQPLNHNQSMTVLLGLHRMLTETMITVTEKIGPREALELKARLIEQAKGAVLVAAGLSRQDEAKVLAALIQFIENAIRSD